MKRGWIAALLLALTACGGGSGDSSGGSDASAHDAAAAIQGKVGTVQKVEDLTEDTDSNELLGRPNGYKAATVIYDSRAQCDGPGVDCGAVIEQWPSESAAKKRADYIQSILKDSPILGSEYDYTDGAILLRISGNLKPSEAQEYEAAFTG